MVSMGHRQAVFGKNQFKHFFRKLNNHKCIVSLRADLHYINRKYEVKEILREYQNAQYSPRLTD